MRSSLAAKFDLRPALVEFVHLAARPKEHPDTDSIEYNKLPYADDVRNLLKDAQSHEACVLLRETFEDGLDHSQLLQLGLFALNDDMSYPGGDPRWSPWGHERPNGRARIQALCEAMAVFARDLDLPKFFTDHASLYKEWEAGYAEELAEQDHVSILEQYTGITPDAPYRVLLCPFLVRETSHVDVGRGSAVTYYPIDKVSSGKPYWAVKEKGPVFWHELGHWMLDPLADIHAEKIKEFAFIYPSKVGECRGSLHMTVVEHTAQGLGIRMCDWGKETGKAYGGRRLDPEDLPIVDGIADGLRAFEDDRDRFKTLHDFYPVWLETFKTAEPKPWWWPF